VEKENPEEKTTVKKWGIEQNNGGGRREQEVNGSLGGGTEKNKGTNEKGSKRKIERSG
jgi:hypothetical protein